MEETTWQVEVWSRGSGSLDGISCVLASVEPEFENHQPHPERKKHFVSTEIQTHNKTNVAPHMSHVTMRSDLF